MSATLKVVYTLSDETRQRQFVATGNLPESEQTVDLDMASTTPEQRQAIAAYCGVTLEVKIGKWSVRRDYPVLVPFRIDEIPDLDAVVRHCQRMAEEKQIADNQCAEKRLKSDTFWQEVQARRCAEKEQRRLEVERYASARQEWIQAYGSEYLRRAAEAGHKADREYLMERAAREYPGFVVDIKKDADKISVSCPSIASLNERDAILAAHPQARADIVWIRSMPHDHEVSDAEQQREKREFKEREAIVVRDELYGKYKLYK